MTRFEQRVVRTLTEVYSIRAMENGWLRVVKARASGSPIKGHSSISIAGEKSRAALDSIVELAATRNPEDTVDVDWYHNRRVVRSRYVTAGEIVNNSSVLESTVRAED